MQFVLYFAAIYLFIFPTQVYAYLDPGTGSYILQMVIGLFLTLGFVFRTSLKRLIIFIKKIIFKTDESSPKVKSD